MATDPEEAASDGETDDQGVADATEEDAAVDTSHLDDIEDGCGCAEVWEHLSENRED